MKDTDKFFTWDEVASLAPGIEELDEDEVIAVHRAARTGHRFLGDIVFEKSRRHPLSWTMVNQAAWTRRWLIWFSDHLELLKNCAGFKSLLNSLKFTDRFYDGLYSMEIARRLLPTGAEIAFENEPDKGRTRQADIVLRWSSYTLHVELTTCGPSDTERKALNTFHGITLETIFRYRSGLHYAGRALRRLSQQHLAEIQCRLRDVMDQARREGFAKLDIEHTLQFAAADETSISLLESWAEDHTLKVDSFDGLFWQENELARVRSKLKRKAARGQIPYDEPGLVVIKSSRALGPRSDILGIATDLEEEVCDYKNLIGVVVVGGYKGVGEGSIHPVSNSVLAINPKPDLGVEYILSVPNRYTNVGLTEETINAVMACFHVND